jgi:flagellar hook-length control protein FliK
MENLQAAAPVTPVSPVASAAAKEKTADAPGDGAPLPWFAALHAALTQHAKGLQPAVRDLATQDPAAPLDTAAPAPPDANVNATVTHTPDDCAALPWVAALQATLTQQTKDPQDLKTVPSHGIADKDTTTADAAASPADEKRQVPVDAGLAAAPTVMPAPLLATVPAIPPATPAAAAATTSPSATTTPTGRAEHARSTRAATPAAVNSDPRIAPVAQSTDIHDAAQLQHAATEPTARADPAPRLPELAAARDGDRRDVNSQPPLQFSPAHAVAAAPPAAPPAAQLEVNTTVGSAAWGAELGQKVVWMIGAKQHVAELHVNPPDLGPLDIKLTVTEHQTTAVFTSPHGAVRDAVESALPRLREVLAESGIMLGNASVTADSPRDGAAFATPQDQAQRGLVSARAHESGPAPAQPLAATLTRRNGLVDLFA